MKNIILLITDTYRFDNLEQRATRSSYVRRAVRTPELDRFAAEYATEITGFYTGSFPTIPHRTDVATGVLGWPHYGWQPIDVSGPNHVAGSTEFIVTYHRGSGPVIVLCGCSSTLAERSSTLGRQWVQTM